MQKHTKIYLDYMNKSGISPNECRCELTGAYATFKFRLDIHHIDARGIGGSEEKDTIDNLMALTRHAHDYFGDKEQYKEWLKKVHQNYLETFIPWIDLDYCPILDEYLTFLKKSK